MSESKMIDVFVTKYALSAGVTRTRGEVVEPHYLSVTDGPLRGLFLSAGDWHHTEAAALARVKEMVVAKSKSLTKAQKKLDALKSMLAEGKLPMTQEK